MARIGALLSWRPCPIFSWQQRPEAHARAKDLLLNREINTPSSSLGPSVRGVAYTGPLAAPTKCYFVERHDSCWSAESMSESMRSKLVLTGRGIMSREGKPQIRQGWRWPIILAIYHEHISSSPFACRT